MAGQPTFLSTSGARPPRLFRVAVPVVAGLLAVAACGGDDPAGPPADGAGPQRAETLTIAIATDEGTLTPFTNKLGYPGANLVRLMFDTLVVLDPDNQLKPLLAEELTSDDNTVWTMPLRDGVAWHDGTPFTAEDVVFSVNYWIEHQVGDSAVDVRGIEDVASEGGTVAITLERADPEFPIRTLADMPILPRHLWQDVAAPGEAGVELAVGTGPYRLESYEPDRGYTLTANPQYALGSPTIDTIEIVVIPEAQARVAALRTGEIQMSTGSVPPQQADQLDQQEGITVTDGVNFASTLLLFNNGRAPFDRAEVRRAMAAAIDVNELVDTVLLGRGTVGNPGFLHPDGPLEADQLEPVYDVAAANAALDTLGAAPADDGVRVLDGEPMRFELLVYSENPERVRAAELIKEMLGEVGIEVAVRTQDVAAVDAQVWPDFDVAQGRNYDLAMWGWSSPTMFDSGRIGSLVASGPVEGRLNVVGHDDPGTDAAAAALLASTTMPDRTVAAKTLQATIAEQMPFVTLYYVAGMYGFRDDAYAGWSYQNGVGILNKFSFVEFIEPIEPAGESAGGSTGE